jgi:hypothetical protein
MSKFCGYSPVTRRLFEICPIVRVLGSREYLIFHRKEGEGQRLGISEAEEKEKES